VDISSTVHRTNVFTKSMPVPFEFKALYDYTLSEAWSGVNWADLMAAHGTFGTDFYDRSTRMIVGTML